MAPTAALPWGRSSRALTVGEQADGTCGEAGAPRRQEGQSVSVPPGDTARLGRCSSGVCALCPRAVGQGATLDAKTPKAEPTGCGRCSGTRTQKPLRVHPFEGCAFPCFAKHRDSPCLLVKGADCAGDRGGSTGLSRFWKARLPAGMIRAHAGRLMKLCAPCYREGASGYLLVIATRASDPKWSGSMQETMSLSVPVKPLQVVGILLGLPLPLVGVYQCPGCGVEVYGVGVEVVEGEPIPVAHGVLVGGAP